MSMFVIASKSQCVVFQEGLTALMMAVKEGHTATVNALLEGCALVNIQENVSPRESPVNHGTKCIILGP